MAIVFVSNYINHHQLPLSEELFRLSGGDYIFLQTEPISEERIKMGWDASLAQKPYVRNFDDDPEVAKKLIFDSEYVIFGGTENEELIIPRLEAGKFTVRYNERLYKEGRWKFISPRGLLQKYHDHIRFRKAPVYMLCAGAYTAGDFHMIGAYPKKTLKFGYFPETVVYDNLNEKRSDDEKVNILWAARFIDWKHPERMLSLAEFLDKSMTTFTITMVGTGELLEKTIDDARNLNNYRSYKDENGIRKITFESGSEILFTGPKTPEEVRELMLSNDVFISTSDQKEGWGAVINEAMNSGCVTVAAREIGAAPWLLQEFAGYTYKFKDIEEFHAKVFLAIAMAKEDEKRATGKRAYDIIQNEWNAKVAAERLYEFLTTKGATIDKYTSGPMSRAK